jgi:hypothetical protein
LLYRLAEVLGMTVERILAEMTVTELNGWILYFTERAAEAEASAPGPTAGAGGGRTGNIMAMDPQDAIAALTGRPHG